MRVEYPVVLGNKTVIISEEAATDVEAFAFMFRMQELYGDLRCTKDATENKAKLYSEKVKLNIRKTKDDDEYYEFVCYDTDPDMQWRKMALGVNQEAKTLYKKKCEVDKKGKVVKVDGKTKYLPNGGWMKWDQELGKEV